MGIIVMNSYQQMFKLIIFFVLCFYIYSCDDELCEYIVDINSNVLLGYYYVVIWCNNGLL